MSYFIVSCVMYDVVEREADFVGEADCNITYNVILWSYLLKFRSSIF